VPLQLLHVVPFFWQEKKIIITSGFGKLCLRPIALNELACFIRIMY
jgi:hypothetical protein